MSALDTDIRDGVDRETVEAVEALGGKYKYGWGYRDRDGIRAQGRE